PHGTFDPSSLPQLSPRKMPPQWLSSPLTPEQVFGRIARLIAELFLDAEQLVVFGQPIRAGERARLDLAGVGGDRNVGNGGIRRLAGAMGDDGPVAGALGELDGVERLAQGSDLVELDQD